MDRSLIVQSTLFRRRNASQEIGGKVPHPSVYKRHRVPRPTAPVRILTSLFSTPRQLSLLYTYHKPSADRSRRCSSLSPHPPAPSRRSRPDSQVHLASTPEVSPRGPQRVELTRTRSKARLGEGQSTQKGESQFIKAVFQNYEKGGVLKMIPVEEETEEEALNFIQEVQPSKENSENEDDEGRDMTGFPCNSDPHPNSIAQGINCTDAEFHIRATCTTVSQSTLGKGSTADARTKSWRTPYKDLSLVGFMPLEEIVDHIPLHYDRRERRKTYTGAGGFTVLAKRVSLIPEMEYGYIPPSPIRPQTQVSKGKRHKSVIIEARIPRAQSSIAQTAL